MGPAKIKSNDKLAALAAAINAAEDEGDIDTLEKLDTDSIALEKTLSITEAALLLYFRSNIQGALQELKHPKSWNWRQPHRERQVLYLRRVRTHPGFSNLDRVYKMQTATNLANGLNTLGRSFEALELYDEALSFEPHFAMALGNRGLARQALAVSLHDQGHIQLILVAAYDDLVASNSPQALWDTENPKARAWFKSLADQIAKRIDVEAVRRSVGLDAPSLGRSRAEKAYRSWCLQRRLFVNPLNVLGSHSIAATDNFGLPDHRAKISDPPQFISWYNQLKQEFSAARLLLFEGETATRLHFSDRSLSLVDTLDYPAFGLSVEKVRLSFRSAYSLLDKVAGFINAYFELNVAEHDVDIRKIWRKGKERLRAEFSQRPNLHLRGLYWLAMDIVGDTPEDQDSIEPEAAHLRKLRNALEHRCLVLRDIETDQPMGIVATASVADFRAHTLQMLKLARAALIYLSLAVNREEQVRARHGKLELIASMPLPTYDPRGRIN